MQKDNQSNTYGLGYKASICLIAFSGVLPLPLADIALITFFIMVIAQRSLIGWSKPEGKLSLTLLGMLALTSIYILFKYSIKDLGLFWLTSGFTRSIFTAALALLYWSHIQKNNSARNFFLSCALLAGSFNGLIGLFQFFGYLPTTQQSIYDFVDGSPMYRSTGLLPHATEYALVGVVYFILGVYKLFEETKLRWLNVFSLALIASGVVVSLGRGPFLILYVAVLVFFSLLLYKFDRSVFKKKIFVFSSIAILIISGFALHNVSSTYIGKRLTDIFSNKSIHSQRIYEHKLALLLLKKYPLGVGMANIKEITAPEIK